MKLQCQRPSIARSGNRIQTAFSASAPRYEALAGLQGRIGDLLLAGLPLAPAGARILDVGMGTGRVTELLRKTYGECRVYGLDIAEGMVRAAQARYGSLSCLQADASQLPFRHESFDLAVSNLAYQWVVPLAPAFAQLAHVLKPDGQLALTLFGSGTLPELRTVLGRRGDILPNLPDIQEVGEGLAAAGLQIEDLHSQVKRLSFSGLPALLGWLKGIGANAGGERVFIGPRRFKEICHQYKMDYHNEYGVSASFEVIWARARR